MPAEPLGQLETWVAELLGPVHGTIQTIRGMCTDERPYGEIDAKLVELDDRVYRLSTAIEEATEASVRSRAGERAATGSGDSRTREPRLQRIYEREWKRHPAQIELLQTIVLRLDRIIELLED